MLTTLYFLPLAFQFQSPGSTIIQLGPLTIRWYGVLIASAVIIGVMLSEYLAKQRNIKPEIIHDLVIWLVIAALPAARLYYVAFNWQNYDQNPTQILQIWRGGIAIHGAISGGIIAAIIYAKNKRISFWQLADLVAPSLILGQAIGRWGNFFNSEAFGSPTNLPWKLFIPLESRPSGYENFAYFHPTFLYESLWNLLIFSILISLFFLNSNSQHRFKAGTLFLIYLVGYSLGRFWIEGLRMDSLMLGPLRMAQVVSLISILVGLGGLFWLYYFNHSLPDIKQSRR